MPTDELRYHAAVPLSITPWFLARPRRPCVLGVWLYLAGCTTLFVALMQGSSVTMLVAGGLAACFGGWAKESGLKHLRRNRLRRHVAMKPLISGAAVAQSPTGC